MAKYPGSRYIRPTTRANESPFSQDTIGPQPPAIPGPPAVPKPFTPESYKKIALRTRRMKY